LVGLKGWEVIYGHHEEAEGKGWGITKRNGIRKDIIVSGFF